MAAAAIITLRETLEASLVVGIMLAYLHQLKGERHNVIVWLGVLAGVMLSLVLAVLFRIFFGGFTGRAEEVYEGILMLTGAMLLTWMILWMLGKRRSIREEIESEVASHLRSGHLWGLFAVALVATLREGVETVIFLQAALVHTGAGWQLFGGFMGIGIAIVLSFVLFSGIMRIPIKKFFSVTSVILIFFAAGLVAHGVHELQEAGMFPVIIEHVWDTNALLDENGITGEFLKGLFGYNGNPSLLEVFAYCLYLLAIAGIWRAISGKRRLGSRSA